MTILTYLFWRPALFSYILSTLKQRQDLLDSSLLFFELFHLKTLPSSSCLLLQVLQCLFDKLDIFNPELFTYNIKIAYRVNIALDMNDLGIVKAPYDLKYGIDRPDM